MASDTWSFMRLYENNKSTRLRENKKNNWGYVIKFFQYIILKLK